MSQQLNSLVDTDQQHQVYTSKADASLFTVDTSTPCTFSIIPSHFKSENDEPIPEKSQPNTGIHSHSKHKYRNTFGDAQIQYHDFDNGNALTFTDKYTVLLEQELQNPYWCLHDPIMTKSYQVSTEIDIETMPHAMYFSVDTKTLTKLFSMMTKACFQQS